ncbi:YbaK/EbsC family protein [Halobiforma nitratireducens]|uniref:YbaK/prolyl-tRNA synthetase associated domain-containing protein n=1 Tax=Halobiforma nitratireducens JCM 10879 TaxID=1227454 RepID=M0MN81_9EURY|nr:YbaK/EbsC family protein [Halobiforma nitratireducens]EMA46833.1 YbaK/prolyl-tRNA synthetase associated domain-containing protein [Halobiforma nitratireducens JCM 10879]
MHPKAATFAKRARERYDFDPDVQEFPDGTKTAEDAADAVGCDVAQIASSLAFDVDAELVVAVTSGANRVDEAALGDIVGVPADEVSMADADRITDALGWSIGGVPPFCHEQSVPVVLDETLLSFDTVWAAAGTPNAVFPIDPKTILEYADAEPARIAA